MHSDFERQYDPDEDPDTDAATTPDDLEGDTEQEQAEGSDAEVSDTDPEEAGR